MESSPISISPPLIYLQYFTMLMSFSLAVVELTWMRRIYKFGWWKTLYGIGILIYALHTFVYYLVTMLILYSIIVIPTPSLLLTNWSSVLRFHGVGVLLTSELQRLYSIPVKREHDV